MNFRVAFFGYNQKEVTEYIWKLHQENEELRQKNGQQEEECQKIYYQYLSLKEELKVQKSILECYQQSKQGSKS